MLISTPEAAEDPSGDFLGKTICSRCRDPLQLYFELNAQTGSGMQPEALHGCEVED